MRHGTVAKDFNQMHRFRSAQLLTLSPSRNISWNKNESQWETPLAIKLEHPGKPRIAWMFQNQRPTARLSNGKWIFNSLCCVCHCDLLWFIVIYVIYVIYCDLCDLLWFMWFIVIYVIYVIYVIDLWFMIICVEAAPRAIQGPDVQNPGLPIPRLFFVTSGK